MNCETKDCGNTTSGLDMWCPACQRADPVKKGKVHLGGPVGKKENPALSPGHYKGFPTDQECRFINEHFKANLAAAIKYIWRCGQKGTPIQDYDKVIEYIQFEKEKIIRECKALGVTPEEVNYQSWVPALSEADIKKKEV